MAFEIDLPVRFGDIDRAGIAYYPSLLHALHIAFEELFDRHVGLTYAALMAERDLGFPTVHMECDFRAPLRYGDVMRIAIAVPEIGRSSALFDHAVRVGDDDAPRLQARLRRVAVAMSTLRPVPIPDDLRAALAALSPTVDA